MAGPSPRSPNSTNGQHIGLQTYAPQQYQTQPSGQYQGQAPNYYQPQPMPPPQQWQPQVQQPMPQSYSPSAQIPVLVVQQQSEDPNLDCKIMAYNIAKWVQLVFVCIELFWMIVLLFQFWGLSESERELLRGLSGIDPVLLFYIVFILIGVCDAFGIAASLLDNTVCQIIHFVLTCLHTWDLKIWYREFFHFWIAVVLLVFMCLGWNELERNRRQRQY